MSFSPASRRRGGLWEGPGFEDDPSDLPHAALHKGGLRTKLLTELPSDIQAFEGSLESVPL